MKGLWLLPLVPAFVLASMVFDIARDAAKARKALREMREEAWRRINHRGER